MTTLQYSDAAALNMERLRKENRAGLICALMAPKHAQAHLLALYALETELARTPHVVSEPAMGELRLAWWQEKITDAAAGRPAEHPVLQGLAGLFADKPADADQLVRAIDARRMDFDEAPFATTDCMVNYADAVNTPVIGLAGDVAGRRRADENVVRDAGIALGLVRLLTGLPAALATRRQTLPGDMVSHHRLDLVQVIDFRKTDLLRPIVQEIADMARTSLRRARKLGRERDGAAAFFPLALAAQTLSRLSANGHDLFDDRLYRVPGMAVPRLWWAGLTGRW